MKGEETWGVQCNIGQELRPRQEETQQAVVRIGANVTISTIYFGGEFLASAPAGNAVR